MKPQPVFRDVRLTSVSLAHLTKADRQVLFDADDMGVVSIGVSFDDSVLYSLESVESDEDKEGLREWYSEAFINLVSTLEKSGYSYVLFSRDGDITEGFPTFP